MVNNRMIGRDSREFKEDIIELIRIMEKDCSPVYKTIMKFNKNKGVVVIEKVPSKSMKLCGWFYKIKCEISIPEYFNIDGMYYIIHEYQRHLRSRAWENIRDKTNYLIATNNLPKGISKDFYNYIMESKL